MEEHPDLVSFILDKIAHEYPNDEREPLTAGIVRDRIRLIQHNFEIYRRHPYSSVREFMTCVRLLNNIVKDLSLISSSSSDLHLVEELIFTLVHRMAYENVHSLLDVDHDLAEIEKVCIVCLALMAQEEQAT